MIKVERLENTEVFETSEQGWNEEKIISAKIHSEYDTNYVEIIMQNVENEYAVKHRLLLCTDEEWYTENERFFIYKHLKRFITAFGINAKDFVKNPKCAIGKTAIVWNDGTDAELIPYSYLKMHNEKESKTV